VALRGYLRQVEESLDGAGVDPARAYVLRIEPSGKTEVETRDAGGAPRLVRVESFPIATPLRIVHVSNVGPARGNGPARPAAKATVKPAPTRQRPAEPGPPPEPL
jgi:hypothetical protein